MHPLLEDIFKTRKYVNTKGETIDIHSETNRAQCAFLQEIITENDFRDTIEVGMAYGMSTLAILELITPKGGRHVVMDPSETDYWNANGLDLIKKAGLESNMEFHEAYSSDIYPQLMQSGRKFDFAYIDSTKLLDYMMVDFFFIDKMLKTGGIVVFDDVSYPAIRKLLSYLSQLPHYEVYKTHRSRRRVRFFWKEVARFVVPWFLLRDDLRVTDNKLNVNAHCVALRKKGEDSRNWDWHKRY